MTDVSAPGTARVRSNATAYVGAFALLSGLAAGVGIGYVAKRPVQDETHFLNFDVESTPSDALGDGWASFEATPGGDTFAWCARTACTIKLNLPSRADRIIRLRAFPFHYPGAPSQTARVTLNGQPAATLTLPEGPTVLSFAVNRSLFNAGTNLLRFEFAYAETPQRRAPPSEDTRTLSAAFDWAEILKR